MASSTSLPAPAPNAAFVRLPLWQNAWRLAVVWLLGVLFWALVVGLTAGSAPEQLRDQDLAAFLVMLDLAVGHLALLVVALRRRWPAAVAIIATALSAVSFMAFIAMGLAVLSLATHRRARPLVLAGVVNALASVVNEVVIGPWTTPEELYSGSSERWVFAALNVAAVTLVFAVIALIGWNTGSRRELVRSWQTEAETSRREQAARVAQAQQAERSRIAREMHDVLAHRLSLVAMHAGVLAHRTDLPEHERQEAAEVVRQGAHQALEELREVLGVLRADDVQSGGAPARPAEAPQPDFSAIPALVAEVTSSGQEVVLDVAPELWGSAHTLPRSTGRHVYRVVQEVLTNARKHAPGQRLRITLDGRPGGGLSVVAANPTWPADRRAGASLERPMAEPLPSGGRGLTGMAERVHLADGRFSAGREHGGDFVVRASFPWPRTQEER